MRAQARSPTAIEHMEGPPLLYRLAVRVLREALRRPYGHNSEKLSAQGETTFASWVRGLHRGGRPGCWRGVTARGITSADA